jgi:peptidoglycan/LPS O-acetylase OafA/YrhL
MAIPVSSKRAASAVVDASPAPPQGQHLRADIQGLRALAVLVVVAFHAGLAVPGGFVGVDVFFVISGFVITAMLQRQWQATGRIRFGAFYLRRFKRLTPALALVVGVTVVGSLLILSPLGPQQTVARTGLGAMLISANIVITHASGDYFDAPAAANPLLHTWSLSVEEQFYLAFPLILLIGWSVAARRPHLRWVTPLWVGFVALASFSLALFALGRQLDQTALSLVGFYGPLSRAWEFAVGALLVLAAPALVRLARPARAAAGLVGVLLMVASLYAISESTPFPGPWTLLPVTATLLLLVAGTGGGTAVSRALATAPMVRVGDWSYSIYLWHWPLIVFTKVLWPGNSAAVVAAAALSLLPAVASYRWVETPIRRLRVESRRAKARLVAAVLVPVLALSFGALMLSTTVLQPRLESSDNLVAYQGEIGWKDHDYRFGGFEPCTDPLLREMVEQAPNYEPRCQQSKPGADVDIALIGDSHVEHLFIGLMEALPDENIMYFTANASPSMENPQYAAAVDYVLATPSIETVLVTAYWQVRTVLPDDLLGVLTPISQSGRRLIVTDDVPDFPFEPFGCKYRASALAPTTCSVDRAAWSAAHQHVTDDLAKIKRELPAVQILKTSGYLCSRDQCSMTRGHDILYADPSHLNVLGSRYVASRLLADHPELGGG